MRKTFCLICGEAFYQEDSDFIELGCGDCGDTLKEKIDSQHKGVRVD